MNNTKKTAFLIFTLLFIFAGSILYSHETVFAGGTADDVMKVRVGFFKFDGYHEIAEDGTMSGYGYDFLQMIAPYANFEYEYIGYDKSWSEIQEMLRTGEIDLLTSARKTPQRLKIFSFSEHEIGFSTTILTTLPTNNKYTTNDYSTFDGMRVGMLNNNSRNESFSEYAARNGFTYTPVYFDTQSDMETAILSGKIDTMLTSDLRRLGNEIIIDKFDESSFFAIVKKGNTEVLNRLNYAINELTSDSPSWANSLSNKYYETRMSSGKISLTSQETAYINKLNADRKRLKVLIRPERAPYSYFDEDGRAKGIFPDILEGVSKQYNLPYEIIKTDSLDEYLDLISQNVPDIIFDSTYDYYQAEQNGYHLTLPYHTAQFCLLRRDDGPVIPGKIAMFTNLSKLNKAYTGLYNDHDYEIVQCASTKDCVQAVFDKKADATYLYVYTALKYVSEDATGFLIYTPIIGTSTNFSIAVKSGADPVLFSVMNRISSNIGEDDIQAAVSNNTKSFVTSNSLIYFVYHEPWKFTGLIVTFIIVILIFIVERSIQQKKEDEKQALMLKEAYDAANHANQAKSNFLSNVSHDIRTPMNVIIGMTAIAEANITNSGIVSECLTKIAVSSRHLLSLVNEVLDMSKIESGKISLTPEDFNLAVLFDNLMSMIEPQAAEKKHELVSDFSGLKHINVIGDSLRLQQVFINIASNAIKYTPDGGHLEITATELDSDDPESGKYKFVFRDNGIGMSREYVQRIFDPFSREKGKVDKIQGTGLGMAIAKNIITMMDGTITVDSMQGVGSTFTIIVSLKLQNEDVDSGETAAAESKNTSEVMTDLKHTDYSDKRILVAEDFDMNLAIIKGVLGVTGMQIDSAANGKLAVEKFEEMPENYYDMIFMDICMPEMNGYEATEAIRALDRSDAKSVPIVALTADAFAEDVEKALNAGMNEHLSKPLEIAKVAVVLRKWLG